MNRTRSLTLKASFCTFPVLIVLAWLGWNAFQGQAQSSINKAHDDARRINKQLRRDLGGFLNSARLEFRDCCRRVIEAARQNGGLNGFDLSEPLDELVSELNGGTGPRSIYQLGFAIESDDSVRFPTLPQTLDSQNVSTSPDEIKLWREFQRDVGRAEASDDSIWAELILDEAQRLLSSDAIQNQILAERLELYVRSGQFTRALELAKTMTVRTNGRTLQGKPLSLLGFTYLTQYKSLAEGTFNPANALSKDGLDVFADALIFNRFELPKAELVRHWTAFETAIKDSPVFRSNLKRPNLWLQNRNAERRFVQILKGFAVDEIRRVVDRRTAQKKASDSAPESPESDSSEEYKAIFVSMVSVDQPFLVAATATENRLQAALLVVLIDWTEILAHIGDSASRLIDPDRFSLRVLVGSKPHWFAGFSRDAEWDSVQRFQIAPGVKGLELQIKPRHLDSYTNQALVYFIAYLGLVVVAWVTLVFGFVTSKLSAEREVALARLRTSLVRNVSHELRTPVASIRMLTEMLEAGDVPVDRFEAYHKRISGAAQRLSDVVENFLSFARIEEGRWTLSLGSYSANEVVAEIVAHFRETEEGRNAKIDCDFPDVNVTLRTDREALKTILWNLLSNAVKYGEKQPITVKVEAQGSKVSVTVRDRGRGISEEAESALFSAFFRERPEDNSAPGIGIGLTIVKQLVGLIDAEIFVHRFEAEPGTMFELRLKIADDS